MCKEVLLKTCSKCHVEKSIGEFMRDKTKTDGLYPSCKEYVSKDRSAIYQRYSAREVIPIPENKTCYGCKINKLSSDFSKNNGHKDGLSSHCKSCVLIYQRLLRYGVTEEWIAKTLESQTGGCAVCHKTYSGGKGTWHVDHNHTTDEPRGLLCHKCNTAIGLLGDSVELLQSAIDYLNKYKSKESNSSSTLS